MSNPPPVSGFFASRWLGQISLSVLFWRDMIAIGSLINLAASVGALIGMASGLPAHWAVAVHFAPVPYNLFLFFSLWRHRQASSTLRLLAFGWLLVVCLL